MQASSENADTKLDTLSEPSAHLIEENVALPEDIFSSYWSYLFHEVLHNIVIMIMFSVNVCLALLFLFFPHKKVHFFYVLSWVVSGFILLVSSIVFTKPINDQDFKINLLIEVIARKPAVKGKEWRTITYNMNQYLFDDDLWNTPYYFYRDKDCRRYFLRLLKGRTFKKQEESSTSNVTGIQSDEATTGTPMEATKSFTFSVGPNFTKLLTKAAEVEQQAQNNYWQERKDTILLIKQQLTREKHTPASVKFPSTLNITVEKKRYKLGMEAPSEITDSKSDTSKGLDAQLIEKNVALPKDIFRSYLSYCIYDMLRYKPIMVPGAVSVGSVLSIVFLHDNIACVVIFAVLAGISLFALMIVGDGYLKPVNRRDFETELLLEVITRKPAVEGKEWKIITYKMNQYLFNHGQWHTPYYFYSDEDCYRYFLRLVEGVTPKKQTATSIGNSPVTAKPEDAIESASPSSRLNYQNFLLKAAEIERQAQENYWRRRHPNIDALLKKTE
ncbi:CRE_collapsed_G0000780.mRNA.1.CDS.1 [Saccharomyces cerevisiae]|nr:CRE_HP_G0011600.mRNA.1.CDS.1 [Saccharomyces cerevisiae]CAI6404608.1 CRE_HP_G0011600.mRNA.1.CDS.1 [Saccharomyces cerevisiae]CAI7128802.1 CRE_collapsed_G0000780.mRNA.1.CDS.1 [Saccharomyces cerevisiae]